MRVLIFATCYIRNLHAREVTMLWAKLTRKLNPDIRSILLIDSASPVDLLPLCEANQITLYSFPDNVGHLNVTGKDGWGRAFCRGIEWAIEHGYDYAVHIDSDMLFAKPVMPIVERMRRSGVKVCCAFEPVYQFMETAVSFYRVDYLKEIDFVRKYDWEHPPEGWQTQNRPPEVRWEEIVKDDLFTLPLRGFRNDTNQFNHNTVRNFPMGLDFMTHCKDFSLYHRFLEMNGIRL